MALLVRGTDYGTVWGLMLGLAEIAIFVSHFSVSDTWPFCLVRCHTEREKDGSPYKVV